jgi:hypothetical protein
MIKFSRIWSMPSPNTFSIKPIKELAERILKDKQGNMNASRKNLVRRKKYGGKKNKRKTKRRN